MVNKIKKYIPKLIKNIFKRFIILIKNIIALLYLKKVSKKDNKSDIIKVAFIVYEPSIWDKQEPVYDKMCLSDNFDVELIVVPSYNKNFKLLTTYDLEWDYFKKYPNAIKAYNEKGNIIDINAKGYDYIFYQTPYNNYYPPSLRSNEVIKFSKICYIPYGFSGATNFNEGNSNPDFFRNVYMAFLDAIEIKEILDRQFELTCKKGYQNFYVVGYPAFEKYFDQKWDENVNSILWTPRWSYDNKIGGSHFFEYKDTIINIKDMYPEKELIIRPHPMMLTNFVNSGLMTENETKKFIDNLNIKKIELSVGRSFEEDLEKSDILITDYSSIIPMYFVTGKPIIYCHSDIINFNKAYTDLIKGIYIAYNEDDIKNCINNLMNGNDYLYNVRKEIIKQLYQEHNNSTNKIISIIEKDFYRYK